jgi:small redox-active disulfide protein 2
MLQIKILGSGCENCKRLANVVERAVQHLGMPANIEKVTDYVEIMKYQVLSTPGLVVNEKLVCAGRIPAEREISAWLAAAQPSA